MKSKIWPRWPRKWPLDLNDLGRGWVDFFKNYIFKISALSWEKWAIARFSSKTNKISNLCYFLAASEDKELKNGSCKSQNRKLSYSSFFSAWCTDFKNVIFEKIYPVCSEVIEVKRSFSRSLRPNFGFHLVFTSLTRESSYSSFFSAWCTDLRNLIFEKNQSAFSEVIEVKRLSRGHFWGCWGQTLDFI